MFDDVLIAIPSKARYDRIENYTSGWLKNSTFVWKVFVEPDEVPLYKRVVGSEHLVNIGDRNRGLAFSMNKIGAYAKKHGYKYIFKIDDDCKGFELWPDHGKVENLKRILEDVIPDMEADAKVGAIRFIGRRVWLFSKKNPKKYTHRNKPLWGICLYRTSCYPTLPVECRQFTDVISGLYLWRDGYDTLTYGKAGVYVLQNQGKGGDHCFDKKSDAYNTIKFLKETDFPLIEFAENRNAELVYNINIDAYDHGYTLH